MALPKATRRDRRARWALVPILALGALGCSSGSPSAADAGADGAEDGPDAAGFADAPMGGEPDSAPDGACAVGGAGLDCLFDLFDDAAESCETARLDALRTSLERRHGDLPAWHQGRALFVSFDQALAVAGDFNDWDATSLSTQSLCASNIYVAELAVTSGRYAYKMVAAGDTWMLDPENWALAFDSFAGNADGANSVLNTYDSGLGHLVRPDVEVCSTELGNCRSFYTYLPAGYGAPSNASTQYPALFMHDGQNIFDDEDCCFGHTGWEVNVRLDAEIAAGTLEPVVVVGFPHAGASRGDEYAYSTQVGGHQETFMAFQTGTVQPKAAELWRLDASRYYVAGSSFGGLISFRLAFAYPDVYAGAASLSGSYWVGQSDGTAMSVFVQQVGYMAMPLYLDHGGTAQSGSDNYPGNISLRDQLESAGWTRAASPACDLADDTLCYYHDVGATHDELAWRDRNDRFLRFFFGI